MAASFLQYCAMCEKQIRTPSNSILYCSQACRRKDAAKPLSASILPPVDAPRSTPSTQHNSRTNSPKRSTTSTRLGSPTPTLQIPAELHAHTTDLDPTEWKPKLCGASAGGRASEAYRYLARFHVDVNDAGGGRPGLHKYSASMYTVPTTTPSLTSSATTAASSFDGVEYDFHTRPLQSRANPLYAVSGGLKSDELVTPHIPPKMMVEGPVGVSDEVLWGKKIVLKRAVAAHGGSKEGLGRLISGVEAV